MRIVAKDELDHIVIELDEQEGGHPLGRVVDTRNRIGYAPALLAAILTRPGWETWEGERDPTPYLQNLRQDNRRAAGA